MISSMMMMMCLPCELFTNDAVHATSIADTLALRSLKCMQKIVTELASE